MLNKAILMGRLVADPENKQTPNGISVTSFRIAVDRDFSQKGAEKQTDFISIVAWRQQADFVARYFKKGSMIVIEGAIQTRTYEDKNGGGKRYAFEVVAERVHFGESKNASQAPSNNTGAYAGTPAPAPNFPVPSAQGFHEPPKGSGGGFSIGDFGDFEELDTDDGLPF